MLFVRRLLGSLLASILVASSVLFTPARAQIVEALGAAAATEAITAVGASLIGKTVNDIIDNLKRTGAKLLDQAHLTGNALLGQAANEANVLAANIGYILGHRLNDSFDKLDASAKGFVAQAELFRQQLSRLTDQAYDFKDSAIIDLNALLWNIPFLKERFFVQSIRGLSFLPDAPSYRLRVFASTLGVDEDVKTALSFRIDDKEVPGVRYDQSKQRGSADITIPAAAIRSAFSAEELRTVTAHLVFTVTRPNSSWLPWTPETVTSEYGVDLYLNLFPKRAATLSVAGKQPIFAWAPMGEKPHDYPTPDRHCSKKCKGEPTRGSNTFSLSLHGGSPPVQVGYQRFTRQMRVQCLAGPCGAFETNPSPAWNEINTAVTVSWDTWSRPTNRRFFFATEEYRQIGEQDLSVQGRGKAEFDAPVVIELPRPASALVLTVTTFTKQKYSFVLGQTDPNGLLQYVQSEASGDKQRFLYQVVRPLDN